MAIDEKTLREITAAIVEVLDPVKVILFGSCARGTAKESSDVDLLVVTRQPFGKGRSRRVLTAQVYLRLLKFLVPKDVLLYSQEEVDFWKNEPGHLIARSIRDGRVLYERQ